MSKSEAPVLDFMGREITVGATVVYPVRRGSSMWMQKLRVTQVIPVGPKIGGFNPEGRRIVLQNIANVTVVEPVPTPQV